MGVVECARMDEARGVGTSLRNGLLTVRQCAVNARPPVMSAARSRDRSTSLSGDRATTRRCHNCQRRRNHAAARIGQKARAVTLRGGVGMITYGRNLGNSNGLPDGSSRHFCAWNQSGIIVRRESTDECHMTRMNRRIEATGSETNYAIATPTRTS